MDRGATLPPGLCGVCAGDVVSAAKFRQLTDMSAKCWTEAAQYLSRIDSEGDDTKTLLYVYEEDTLIFYEKRSKSVKSAVTVLGKYEEETSINTNNPTSCPFCDKRVISLQNLNQHLKTSSKIMCICGRLMNKSEICKHLRDTHKIEVFECSMCHEQFRSNEELKRHSKESHSDKLFVCEHCGRGYRNQRALRAHYYTHTLFNCSACGRTFENIRCYRHHKTTCISKHTNFSVFECHDCGRLYDKKASLRIHVVQKHLNVLPFVCQVCGKKTSTLNHLKSHSKVHEADRKIRECHCGAKFRTDIGYRLHMRIHSGLKPFKCEECEESFISASRRSDHMKRRHRSVKDMPHGCEHCSARFVRPWELKRHYKLLHNSLVDVQPVKRQKSTVLPQI